ncbi:hypothetical protein WG68_01200 [Arsukibacterium ikkense]|uniref:Thiol-disulfide oxidoreductase n=1 Tax=Arsukibacterium ikkense TaxID=336831 RepID=A0A0M2V9L2_9GAMM|nr:DCC1-like thiol-disulfide oxidoreductase family protein [Arsukibacterium ikkense]KKO47291.1 hypothetical protein WG68_01200 [Arsukibacterium ikkense]
MSSDADHHAQIRLIYDGECPLCRNFSQAVRIRQSLGQLQLVNARNRPDIRQMLQQRELDIDKGMVLQLGASWYHGAAALQMLAMISSRSGVFNRLNYWLFKSPGRARLLYPLLRAGRNVLLRLLRITKINQ